MTLKIRRYFPRLPALIWTIMFFTVVTLYGGGQFLGYNLSGLGWVVPLVFSLLVIARNPNRITFPVVIWLPWALVLLIYFIVADLSKLDPRVAPFQRMIQLLCPIIVGIATSTYRLSPQKLSQFINLCRTLSFVVLGLVLFKSGLLLTGQLPGITGLAAEVMTVMLLCSLFANRYLLRHEKRDVILWSLLAIIPVIAVTRTAIVATLLTLPLACGHMSIMRRLIVLIMVCAVGVGVFYSSRVQEKMFYSGKGEISDVMSEGFRSTGRFQMWENMKIKIKDAPLTGHGIGTGETFVYRLTRGNSGYPHNDWLLLRYDHGLLGVGVFSCCILLSIGSALFRARSCTDDDIKTLLLAGASSFIPFAMMMTTDNIMIYASFFGNLHFTILGLAYGAFCARKKNAPVPETSDLQFSRGS